MANNSLSALLLVICFIFGAHSGASQEILRLGSKVRFTRVASPPPARQPPPRRAASQGAAASPPQADQRPPPVNLPPAPPSPAPPVVYRNDQLLRIAPGEACDPTANFTRVSGPACALVAGPIDAPNGNNYLSGLPVWPATGPRFPRFSYLVMASTGQLNTIRYTGGAAWSVDGTGGNITRLEGLARRRAQDVTPAPAPAPEPAPAPATPSPAPGPGPAAALVLRSDGSFVFTRSDGSPTGVGSATLGVVRAGAGGEANAPFTMRLLDFPGQVPSLDLAIYNKHEELVWSLFGGGNSPS